MARAWLHFLCGPARQGLSGGSQRCGRCALLIDGDNVSPALADPVMEFASSVGDVRWAEVFANFASPSAARWASQLRGQAISGLQTFAPAAGKNAADISLTIRAMDLLHRERADGYILVSSDADFSALAQRLRRSGAQVHGVGSPGSATALRQSCTSFRTFQDLSNIDKSGTSPAAWSRQPNASENVVLAAIARLGGGRRWVTTSELGEEIRRTTPSFDPRSYSRRTLTELCDELDSIDVDRTSSSTRVRIALRET
jgi:uncharacterized protein (TIGR00288 family)